MGDRWQSVLTRRLTGEGGDAERVERLLQLMRPYSGDERRASWTEALAVADNGRLLACWEVEGATGVVAQSPGPLGLGARLLGFQRLGNASLWQAIQRA